MLLLQRRFVINNYTRCLKLQEEWAYHILFWLIAKYAFTLLEYTDGRSNEVYEMFN